MKTIHEYISEALSDRDRSIVDMLKIFASSSSGVQSKLFTKKLDDADSVDISRMSEAFTKEEISDIKKHVRPKVKCCYENAWKLCDYFAYDDAHDVKYCEGYMNFHGLPIEHAFNRVDGKYVDITAELALKNDAQDATYVALAEYDADTVREILLQNGFYGNIYDTIFLNGYRESIKA